MMWNEYPYSNVHELNLDWIIKRVYEYVKKVDKLDIDFKELKDYVVSYFDNLDIQEEVNNKLDEMAESGELADIIAQYLELQSLICFNTKNAMKNADNLVDDSSVITLGTETYNDGKTRFYKIRTLTSGDIIDDINIIALANYPTLIAEWLNKEEEIKGDSYILIGDSYTGNVNRDGVMVIGWWQRLIETLGLTEGVNVWKSGEGSSGYFRKGIDNHNFYDLLVNITSTLTSEQKNKITKILLAGGVNDARYNPDDDYIPTFNSLSYFVETNFPNAKIYIVPIGMTHETRGRRRLIPKVYQKIKDSCLPHKNIIFIHGAWLPLYNTSTMASDGLHPNNKGEEYIARNLIQGLNGIECHHYERNNVVITLDDTLFTDGGPYDIEVQMQDNVLSINFSWVNQLLGNLVSAISNYTMNDTYRTLGTYQSDIINDTNGELRLACTGRVRISGGQYEEYRGVISFSSGEFKLITLSCNKNAGWISGITVNRIFVDSQHQTVFLPNM